VRVLPRQAGWTRLVLVRHADPDAAARGRCYGDLDVALSRDGLAEAERLADWLEPLPLTAIYASPRRRTVGTAQPIAARHGLTVDLLPSLRELNFGDFEGLTYDQAKARHPEIYAAWMTSPTEVVFPNGESWPLLRARVTTAALDLRRRHIDEEIALVAHGGPLRAILAAALGLPDPHIFRLEQAYASVSIIDYLDEEPIVRLLNGRP
jgi:broad specificity phosphatase PhoE